MRPPVELIGGPQDGLRVILNREHASRYDQAGGYYVPVDGTDFYRWVPE